MFETVVGLEIHIQVKTNSKMFCRCRSNYFEAEPNTHVCPVCIGLPGALPIPNKEAFEKAIKLALALNCKIAQKTKFDRKNYFYPDLPKGYQISQFDQPIGQGGFVEIEVEGDVRRIRLTRLHLEEDTAKSIHSEDDVTLIDYNKSGVALIEIVTEPDFTSKAEVVAFARRLRQIVRYCGISDAEMQKGHMRFELNISLKTGDLLGSKELPNYKVEVKNIGSISVLEKVINFEEQRQFDEISKKGYIKSQTRGLKDMSGETFYQRSKETSDDYRYFPEPDIPPIEISQDLVNSLSSTIPVLPNQKKYIYKLLGLENEQAEIFVEDLEKSEWFDKLITLFASKNNLEYDIKDQNKIIEISNFLKRQGKNQIKESCKWFTGDIVGLMERKKISVSELKVTQQDVLDLVKLVEERRISGSVAKSVLEKMFGHQETRSFQQIIKEEKLEQVSDESQIDSWIKQVIIDNADIVSSLKKNPNAIKALVGAAMRLSQGKINPHTAEEKLRELLGLN